MGERLTRLEHLIITDIDNTLMGDDDALEDLLAMLEAHRERIGFGVATGRSIASTKALFERKGLEPSRGAHHLGRRRNLTIARRSLSDKGWQSHISKWWGREKIQNLLADPSTFWSSRNRRNSSPNKLSYYMTPDKNRLVKINAVLNHSKCHCTVIYSHDEYLDILPHRASKGKAVRYLSYKWEIPLENIMVCGDSGNDREMLIGSPMGVVVGNYARELESLKGKRRIYFSPKNYAAGIIDGLNHFGLISEN